MKRLFLALTMLAGVASAQTVQDPTRPPAQLLRPAAGGGVVAAGPQLQSILIGRNGSRRVAVIDGDTVRVGDRVAGARVVAINAGTVLLEQGGVRTTLTLQLPGSRPE